MCKTAICFSGELRSIDKTLPLIKERIFSRFSDYDIFYFTWNDDPDIEKLNLISDLPQVKKIETSERMVFNVDHFMPTPILSGNPQGVLRQFFCLKQTHSLRNQYEYDTNIKYDIVVHIRPDLFILNDTYLDQDIESKDMNYIYKLDHDNWRGYSDRFYISNAKNMDIICHRFDQYRKYSLMGAVRPYEEYLKFIIDINDMKVKDLQLKTCLLRTDGQLLGEEISIMNGELVKINGRLWHERLKYFI